MRMNVRRTVELREVVAAAFDWAAQCSSDPREVPLLATKAVEYLLGRAQKTLRPRPYSGILASGREKMRADDHAA
jgi:hypothetical protein